MQRVVAKAMLQRQRRKKEVFDCGSANERELSKPVKVLGARLRKRRVAVIQGLGKSSPVVCGAVQSRLCRKEISQRSAYKLMAQGDHLVWVTTGA